MNLAAYDDEAAPSGQVLATGSDVISRFGSTSRASSPSPDRPSLEDALSLDEDSIGDSIEPTQATEELDDRPAELNNMFQRSAGFLLPRSPARLFVHNAVVQSAFQTYAESVASSMPSSVCSSVRQSMDREIVQQVLHQSTEYKQPKPPEWMDPHLGLGSRLESMASSDYEQLDDGSYDLKGMGPSTDRSCELDDEAPPVDEEETQVKVESSTDVVADQQVAIQIHEAEREVIETRISKLQRRQQIVLDSSEDWASQDDTYSPLQHSAEGEAVQEELSRQLQLLDVQQQSNLTDSTESEQNQLITCLEATGINQDRREESQSTGTGSAVTDMEPITTDDDVQQQEQQQMIEPAAGKDWRQKTPETEDSSLRKDPAELTAAADKPNKEYVATSNRDEDEEEWRKLAAAVEEKEELECQSPLPSQPWPDYPSRVQVEPAQMMDESYHQDESKPTPTPTSTTGDGGGRRNLPLFLDSGICDLKPTMAGFQTSDEDEDFYQRFTSPDSLHSLQSPDSLPSSSSPSGGYHTPTALTLEEIMAQNAHETLSSGK